ncbi:MAG TPA: hypothetical protein ENG03_00035 [Thioploca sp.]|nr:hypothetical protein [Thioploca sp.]
MAETHPIIFNTLEEDLEDIISFRANRQGQETEIQIQRIIVYFYFPDGREIDRQWQLGKFFLFYDPQSGLCGWYFETYTTRISELSAVAKNQDWIADFSENLHVYLTETKLVYFYQKYYEVDIRYGEYCDQYVALFEARDKLISTVQNTLSKRGYVESEDGYQIVPFWTNKRLKDFYWFTHRKARRQLIVEVDINLIHVTLIESKWFLVLESVDNKHTIVMLDEDYNVLDVFGYGAVTSQPPPTCIQGYLTQRLQETEKYQQRRQQRHELALQQWRLDRTAQFRSNELARWSDPLRSTLRTFQSTQVTFALKSFESAWDLVTSPETSYQERRAVALQAAAKFPIRSVLPQLIATIKTLKNERQTHLHYWGLEPHPLTPRYYENYVKYYQRILEKERSRPILGHQWVMPEQLLEYPLTPEEETNFPWPRQVEIALNDWLSLYVELASVNQWAEAVMAMPGETRKEAKRFIHAMNHKIPNVALIMGAWRNLVLKFGEGVGKFYSRRVERFKRSL